MTVVLGLDVGSVRIGVAASDPTRTLATPVAALQRKSDVDTCQRIKALAEQRGAVKVVVGLPLQMNGTTGTAAEQVTAFAETLHELTGLEVQMWDERLSTVAAEKTMIASGVRRRARRERMNSAAAAMILQGWLDSPGAKE